MDLGTTASSHKMITDDCAQATQMLKAGTFPRAFCFKPSLLSVLSRTFARLKNEGVGHLGLKALVARLVVGPVAGLAVGLAPGVVIGAAGCGLGWRLDWHLDCRSGW